MVKKLSFKLYREYGALNSLPIFDAVEAGLKHIGHIVDPVNGEIPVIWSVLWAGRMLGNRDIYYHARSNKKPIIILEVGNLQRNKNWRISLNHVNGLGYFGNNDELDLDRPKKLGINLAQYQNHRKSSILITAQHENGLQWENMPNLSSWLAIIVNQIRTYSQRKIIFRYHPRWIPKLDLPKDNNLELQRPIKIPLTYDNFDIDFQHHCVINHNSGPAVQAAIAGVPVICHSSSLAYPISNLITEIDNLKYPDRELWFVKMCHTEWTIDEISKGIPFIRLHSEIEKFML